jgi:hypothetical protein
MRADVSRSRGVIASLANARPIAVDPLFAPHTQFARSILLPSNAEPTDRRVRFERFQWLAAPFPSRSRHLTPKSGSLIAHEKCSAVYRSF